VTERGNARQPFDSEARKWSGALGVAYREFERYMHECYPCYPVAPRRVFGFAVKLYHTRYARVMDLWQFLGCVYDTLGYGPSDRMATGLFAAFDPNKYHGRLDPAKHFLNGFSRRLRDRLRRCLYPRTDQRRTDKRGVKPDDVLGFLKVCRLPETPRWRCGSQKLLESLPDRQWPPRGLGELEAFLLEAYWWLTELEIKVLTLAYSSRKMPSLREMGRSLGIDHKTVRRHLEAALDKLRQYFQNEILSKESEEDAGD
jgi:hypothetical protein